MAPARRHHHRRNTRTGSGAGPWIVAGVLLVVLVGAVVFALTRGRQAGDAAPPVTQATPRTDLVLPPVEEAPVTPPEAAADDVPAETTGPAPVDEPMPAKGGDEPLGFSELPPVESAPVTASTRRLPRRPVTAGRSPLLEVGEFLEHPIPAPRLDDGPAFSTSPLPAPTKMTPKPDPGEIVPWGEAGQHVGRTITIGGKVVLTNNTGSVCFLNFVKDWRGKFYVIIFRDVLNSWPQPPQTYFLNKTVAVTGEVRLRDGTPQIQVRKADQIRIVDDGVK